MGCFLGSQAVLNQPLGTRLLPRVRGDGKPIGSRAFNVCDRTAELSSHTSYGSHGGDGLDGLGGWVLLGPKGSFLLKLKRTFMEFYGT